MKNTLAIIAAALYFVIAASAVHAQVQAVAPPPTSLSSDVFLGIETFRLWSGRAEGASGDESDQTPTITVFRPQANRVNGAAVVVAPGGGYLQLAGSLEGREVADWFAARGVTAFVLKYRLASKARLPLPLADGRRAIRFVRAHAAGFKLDPARIGMIGFSAGGHLSAMTAVTAEPGNANAADLVDRVSSRPDFLVLGYPWLEATVLDAKDESQYCIFAKRLEPKAECNPRRYEQYLPTPLVTAAMMPTFIYHTTADKLVRAEGSLRFYEALHAKNVPVEMHVFGPGEHGTGLGGSDPALTPWGFLLENWLRQQGVFGRVPVWPTAGG